MHIRSPLTYILLGVVAFGAQSAHAFDAKASPLTAISAIQTTNCTTAPQECLYIAALEHVARARACVAEQSKRTAAASAATPSSAATPASSASALSEKTLSSKGYSSIQSRIDPLLSDPSVKSAVFAPANPLRDKIQADISGRLSTLSDSELKNQCKQSSLKGKTAAELMATSSILPQAGIRNTAPITPPPLPPSGR